MAKTFLSIAYPKVLAVSPLIRFLALTALALLSLTASAEVLEGRVASIADGDTITLLDSNRQQHRIRLAGIDAPEKGQPFGQRSKQHLAELAFGKDIGLAQLDAGLAWWFRKCAHGQHPKDRIDYEAAEDRAAADRIGL